MLILMHTKFNANENSNILFRSILLGNCLKGFLPVVMSIKYQKCFSYAMAFAVGSSIFYLISQNRTKCTQCIHRIVLRYSLYTDFTFSVDEMVTMSGEQLAVLIVTASVGSYIVIFG